jgi:putative peptidoglycan lipid II flippase
MKHFLKRFAPATAGSAGTQIALFADTIIASFLSAGAISALYYADRINQLPIGVIGVAVGTVLLPEMSRRIAAGDEAGSRHAQNRAVELTLLLTLPCVAAFLLVPDLIMRALFLRGAFSAANAHASAMTLVAYAFGLIPFVLMRSATITFLSRGDTVTPVKALAVAVTVNVAFKILFVYATSLEQVGLALATSIGAWVNLILLLWLASRAGLITVDAALRRTGLRLVAATLMLGLVLWLAASPVADVFAGQKLHEEATLAALAVLGALVYGGVALTLLGKGWLAALRRRQGSIS